MIGGVSRSFRHTAFILFSVCLLALNGDSVRTLIEFSFDATAASQVVLVPFISGALVYWNKKEIFRVVGSSVLPGLLVLVLAGGLRIVQSSWGAQLDETDRLALATAVLILCWFGGFLLFYGAGAFRRALFPLLFLIFCIPIPSAVLAQTIAVLQHGTAELAYALLKLSGTPVYREGLVFAMPNLVIDVAPECSGIRSSIGMVMTSLLAGYLMLHSRWKRAALVAVALFLAVLKNAIRIDALSLLSVYVDPGIIEGRLHHEGGILFFGLGLMLLYPVLMWFVKSERSRYVPIPTN